jgi:hypothetical protein
VKPGKPVAVAVLMSALTACSASAGLTDAETVWCNGHVVAVMSTASELGVLPAEIPGPVDGLPGAPPAEANELLVFKADRARALAEEDEARGIEPADYHTLGYLRVWKQASPNTYRQACQAAFGAH